MLKNPSSKKLKIFLTLIFFSLFLAGAFWFWKNPEDFFTKELKTSIGQTDQYKSIAQFQMQSYNYATEQYENLPLGYQYQMALRRSTESSQVNISNQVLECNTTAPANGRRCFFPYNDLLTFKVFLSPKALSQVTIFNSQGNGGLYAVARLNQAISKNYTQRELEDLVKARGRVTNPLKINEVSDQDGVVRNGDGITNVFNDTSGKGDWLYVKVFSTGASVSQIDDMHIFVNWSDFTSFYDAYSGWQPNGDPADPFLASASSSPTISPTSNPTITPTPTSMSTLPGDIEPVGNPDGDVDIYDYNIFIQNWGKSAVNNPADIDKNGKVDIFDYNLLVGNFGT